MITTPLRRFTVYAGMNVAFFLLVGTALACGNAQDPRIPYLVLLFALCSSTVIDLDGLNGRYALLGIFLIAYFVMFGLADLSALIVEPVHSVDGSQAGQTISRTESVVLVGALLAILAYRSAVLVCSLAPQSPLKQNWSKASVMAVGLMMWLIGTYATYHWYIYIITGTTNEAVRRGLQSQGTWLSSAYILAQMMQPLGMLLIAYLWRMARPPLLWVLIAAVIAVQVWIGFIAELKGLALLGGILIIVTIVLIDGRIPKLWLAGAVICATIVFPIFQTYRAEIAHDRGLSRTSTVANFGHILDLVLAAETRVTTGPDRAQTFLERSSLLGSVQTIVDGTANGVPYQHGFTLTPIWATFVPKILWSDKPDVPTGQIMNKAFHITDSDDIFISPSHLGELYWNFGWPGVIVGMSAIGALLGFVGARFNLAQGKTVTRLLVTVVTIKQLVAGFESSIAAIYVVWLRSLAGIALLHLIFARVPAAALLSKPRSVPEPSPSDGVDAVKPFPNLLA